MQLEVYDCPKSPSVRLIFSQAIDDVLWIEVSQQHSNVGARFGLGYRLLIGLQSAHNGLSDPFGRANLDFVSDRNPTGFDAPGEHCAAAPARPAKMEHVVHFHFEHIGASQGDAPTVFEMRRIRRFDDNCNVT